MLFVRFSLGGSSPSFILSYRKTAHLVPGKTEKFPTFVHQQQQRVKSAAQQFLRERGELLETLERRSCD